MVFVTHILPSIKLEGAFACVFKSIFYPGECVATRYVSKVIHNSTSSHCILQTWISTSGRHQGRRVRKRLDPSPVQPGGPSQDVRSHPSRPGPNQFPSYSKEEDQCYVQSGLRPRMYLVFSFQITSVFPGYKTL